jgi:hypothetical protein
MSLLVTNPATGLPWTEGERAAEAEEQRQWRMANDECADPLTGASVENWAQCDHDRLLRRAAELGPPLPGHASLFDMQARFMILGAAIVWLVMRKSQ